MSGPDQRKGRVQALVRRALPFLLAAIAIGFVAKVVPIRDRCLDPVSNERSVRVVTPDGCLLEPPPRAGELIAPRHLSAADCASLTCEPGLASVFERVRLPWLLAMMALYFVGTFAWAVRWRELLELAKLRLSRLYVWRVTLEAQAGGILLPGGVAGDALRIGSIVGKGVPVSTVVASVLLDRVIGLVTLASVAGACALLGTGTPVASPSSVSASASSSAGAGAGAAIGTPVALVLAAFPVGLVLGLVIVRSAPVARFLSEGPLARFAREPVRYIKDDRALAAIARATAISVVVSLTQLLVVRGLVTTLGAEPTEARWVFMGAAMAFMVAAVPVLPGGWGTSDAAYVFFFRFAGLSPQVALGVCLLYRAFWYLSGLLGALLRLTRSRPAAQRTP